MKLPAFVEAPLLLVGFPDVTEPFCVCAQPSARCLGGEQRWVHAAARPAACSPSFLLLATAGTEIMGIKELLATAWWLLRLCWRTSHHPGVGCAGWFASTLFQPWGFPGALAHVCGSWQGRACPAATLGAFLVARGVMCVWLQAGGRPRWESTEWSLVVLGWSSAAWAVLLRMFSHRQLRASEGGGDAGVAHGIYLPWGACVAHLCSR